MKTTSPEIIRLKGVSKRYGSFYAIQDVDLTVRGGEVHVLFGENGAGKSTIIKIVSGVITPDGGEVEIAGVRMTVFSPEQARRAGVGCVFQEFSLAPDLTVEENLFLGREKRKLIFLSVGKMRRQASQLIAELGFALRLNTKVKDLSRAQRQMVEIAKALLQDVKVLILDEPTASLTEIETRSLFRLLERFKARGVAILYVSHRLKEIERIADRITVLRNGRRVDTVLASNVDEGRLIELMVGRRLDAQFPKISSCPGEVALETASLSTNDGRLRDISLVVRAGEIVGLAGLIGSGNSDVLRAIYGLDQAMTGQVLIEGRAIRAPTPSKQLQNGISYFPSDRIREGLALSRSVRENVTVTLLGERGSSRWGKLRSDRIDGASAAALKQLGVRPADDRVPVGSLSGGNRQRVMLARGVVRKARVYLFDEPTVGIDIGAKAQVYAYIKSIVDEAGAVLLVSSELFEIMNLAHRIYVMSEGRIISELQGADISEEAILNGCLNTVSSGPNDAVR